MKTLVNYGEIRRGTELNIVEEGFDYYTVTHRGQRIQVPKPFVGNYVEPLNDTEGDETERAPRSRHRGTRRDQ